MNDSLSGIDRFGARKPAALWQKFVSFSHTAEDSWVSRLCAPLVRKALVSRYSAAPVDLRLKDFNLRCQFTHNYSEKKFVFTPWQFDQQERKLLTEQLANGGTFIDIGANVGLYTLFAAKALQGKRGRIVALEPNPLILNRFNVNMAANPHLMTDDLQLDVLELGVSDRDAHFDLYVAHVAPGETRGISGFRSRPRQQGMTITGLRCRPLMDILADLGVNQVDALKIDIEGTEDLALMPYLESAPRELLAKLIIIENSERFWKKNLFGKMSVVGYQRVFESEGSFVFRLTNP